MIVNFFQNEQWKTIINGPFIPIYQVNGEVVDRPYFLWTEEEKRNFEIDFETDSLIVMSLDDSKLFYVHNRKTTKGVCDTL